MSGMDWTLLALLFGGLLLGYVRGFVSQLVSFAGFFVAYIVAYKWYGSLAPVLKSTLALPTYEVYQKYDFVVKGLNLETYVINALSFALMFFGVKVGLSVIGRLLNFVVKVPGLNFVNRWSGALLGFVEALLLIIIAVNVMTILPSEPIQGLLTHSVIAPYMINDLPSIAGKLQELWKQSMQ